MSELPPFDPPLRPVPMEEDAESYRAPGDDPAEALGGRVLFGGPFAERVEADPQQADEPDVVYTLVRSAVSFTNGPHDAPFVAAEVHCLLDSAPPGDASAPVVWSMAPDRISADTKVTTRRRFGPQLKVIAVEAVVGERESTAERSVPSRSLTTAGLWTAAARWTLRHTDESPLDGQQPILDLVVKHRAGATTDLTVHVYAWVRGGALRRYSNRALTPGFLRIRLP